MLVFICIVAMLSISIASWVTFRSVLNPITLYSLSYILTLLATIIGDTFSKALNVRIHIETSVVEISAVYLLSVIVFALVFIIGKVKVEPIGAVKLVDAQYMSFNVLLLSCALIVSVVFTMLMLGHVPVLEMIKGTIKIRDHINSLKNLPIGLMAFNTWLSVVAVSILSTLLVNKSYCKGWLIKWLVVVLVVAILWQGTRQLILMSVFLLVARSMQLNPKYSIKKMVRKYAKYLMFLLVFILLFIIIQNIRLHGEGTSKMELLMYLSWPTLNMMSILENVSPDGMMYLLSQIVPNRLLGVSIGDKLSDVLFEPTSPSGYLSLWYLAYGYIGIVIGSLVFGFASKKIYNNRLKSESWLRVNNLFLWACATSGIYSHFLHLNLFIMPVFMLIFHGYLFHRNQKNRV